MSNWTQPICEVDWIDQHAEWEPVGTSGIVRLGGVRQPVRLAAEAIEVERCAWCGKPTIFGAYVRADPKSVRFPKVDAEEQDVLAH